MLPYVEIFGRQIATYSLCTIVGAVLAIGALCLLAPRRGLKVDQVLVVALVSMVPLLLGGSLFYGLSNAPVIADILANWSSFPTAGDAWRALGQCFSGMVFYGGLIGMMLGLLAICRIMRYDTRSYLELFAVAIPLFHCMGRIGCFLAGCCYGIEFPVGFVMQHAPVPDANGVTRLPVQLVEAAFNLALFVVLLWMFRHAKMPNRLLGVYLVAYPVGRFVLEFLRGDAYRGIFGPFSTSQWISLVLLVVGIVFLVRTRGEGHGGSGSSDTSSAATRGPRDGAARA